MTWKLWLGIIAVIPSSLAAGSQNSTGNVMTGNAKVVILRSYGSPDTLPKPDRILIQDFTTAGDIVMDASVASRLQQHHLLHGKGEDNPADAVVRSVQDSFAKTLISQFKKMNIETDRVPDANSVTGPDLVIEGEFIAVNQGDATQRIMLGFGRGASDIKTHLIVSLVAHGRKTLLLECNINAESGKKPGAIIGMGGGSLAVGAATGDIGDKRSTVQADASRIAKLVGKQVDQIMTTQKWISAPAK